MEARDPYDVRVAFDDVYGDVFGDDAGAPEGPSRERLGEVMRAILGRLSRLSRPRGEREVHVLGRDVSDVTFKVYGADCLGGSADEFPLFSSLKRRFRSVIGEPRVVRVDDEESYKKFRAARKDPYVEKLEARLAVLEQQVSDHVSDDHGGGKVKALEDVYSHFVASSGTDVSIVGVAVEAHHGGQPVPLFLPKFEKQVKCWQDGREILCTGRVKTPDGVRFLTTGGDLQSYVEDVLGCALEVGADPEDTVQVAPALAQVHAGRSLLSEVAKSRRSILGAVGSGTGACVVAPRGDAQLAGAMSLLQRFQRGNKRARREVVGVAYAGGAELVCEAWDRLRRAQAEKRRRS